MNTSIILIAYHADKWLPSCITSLGMASGQKMHLVLVDNSGNSILDSLDYSAFDLEILKTPAPLGFAEANNYALANASRLEQTITFLNQDTISQEGWVDACIACFNLDSTLVAVSPLIKTYDGADWDPSFMDCLPVEKRQVLHSTGNFANNQSFFYSAHAPAPSLVVRSEALRKSGPFDPVFGSYYEDYDLCRRLKDSDGRIGFCTQAVIYHFSGSTTTTRERELKRMRQIIRNRIIFRLREANDRRLPLLIQYFMIDFPRRLIRGLFRTSSSQPPLVTLKAYSDLVKIIGRLVSRKKDENTWKKYLNELGWPSQIAGFRMGS